MTADPTLQAYRALCVHVSQALDQAKLAYEFSPNSYSYGALSACLAAEQALGVLCANLADAGASE